ncbi:hypothetical protein ACWKWP_13525 [Agromyces soli]
MTRRLITIATAGVAALLLAGCAGQQGTAQNDAPAAETARPAAPTAAGFEAELAYVPAGGDLTYGDYDAARAALGLDADAPVTEVLGELDEGLGMTFPDAYGWSTASLAPEIADTIGVSIDDVGRFVVARGDDETVLAFDAPDDAEARLTAALGEPVDGIWEHGEVEGSVDLSLGEAAMYAQRIALIDDRVVIATSRDTLERLQGGESAADDARAVAVARAFDERGAVAAIVNAADEGVAVDLLAAGVSPGEAGPRVHFVAAADGDLDALADALRAKFESGSTGDGDPLAEMSGEAGTPYAELFELVEVTVGDVVVADAVPLGAPSQWLRLVLRGELW